MNALSPQPVERLNLDDRKRAATRATTAFCLRQVQLVGTLVEGEFLLGLLLMTIIDANSRHLDDPSCGERYQALDDVPPDAVRRPISVMALSQSVGLPYETTRRYVGRLIRLGLCQRVDRGGLIVPANVISQDRAKALTERSFQDVRRLVVALRRAGVDIDSMR